MENRIVNSLATETLPGMTETRSANKIYTNRSKYSQGSYHRSKFDAKSQTDRTSRSSKSSKSGRSGK